MQTAKVTTENALIGWREIASLNDIATPILPMSFPGGCHAAKWLESINAAIRSQPFGERRDELTRGHDKPWKKIQ
jgi:hypothetical protein